VPYCARSRAASTDKEGGSRELLWDPAKVFSTCLLITMPTSPNSYCHKTSFSTLYSDSKESFKSQDDFKEAQISYWGQTTAVGVS
jgi:hypothetical protein